ncbi:MAG: hypothetical protein J6K78_02730 [Tidjanibacter sp.]|nr:hypothetical protein [Tidjanibacter sp.]
MRVRYALLLCALLFGSSLHLWAQRADGSELYPRQHYNYSLYGCGDELLLSSANMRVANKGEAHFEPSERGGVPSVVMNIHSERKGRLFGFQKFIVVQPSTGYSVCYDVEALRTTTPAPLRLVATLYDDAREVVATISHTLDGVGEGAFDFTTHPLTRCAKIALYHTTDESQVEGVVKGMRVVQTTPAGALRREEVVLRRVNPFRKEGKLWRVELGDKRAECWQLSLDVEWRRPQAERGVHFEWYNAAGELVERHECRISKMRGVVPEEDGVRVEWFRRWDRLPQGVSIRNQYIGDTEGVGCGRATVLCRVPQVEGAVLLVVRSTQPQGDAPTIATLTVSRDY